MTTYMHNVSFLPKSLRSVLDGAEGHLKEKGGKLVDNKRRKKEKMKSKKSEKMQHTWSRKKGLPISGPN